MPIALGVLLVAVLALGFMSMQAMLERLQVDEPSQEGWRVILAPVVSALGLLNRAQRKVWTELVAIMSRFAGASLHALAHWFWSLEHLAADVATSITSLAETVADAFEHALTVTVPHAIKTAVQHEGRLRQIADEQLRRYARGIDRLVRDHVLPRVRAVERAVTVTIPRELAGIRAREKAIAGRIPRGLAHRLTRLEKITAAAAIAGAVVKVLARRFPWLFCRKTNMIGKRLCGMDADYLNAVLSTALLVSASLSLAEMARALREPTEQVAHGLESLIRELR